MAASGRERIAENPFYVLGVRPDCGRAELERAGQKWIAMLELGLAAAKSYATPLGPQERTPEKVRMAMAELREPARRLEHELWARLDPEASVPAPRENNARRAPWVDARRKGGWL